MAGAEFIPPTVRPINEISRLRDLLMWGIRASSFSNYLKDFQQVDEDCIIESFCKSLKEKEPAVILDFLSWTEAIRSLVNQYHISSVKGAAVAYSDTRGIFARLADRRLNIKQLCGDLNTKTPWKNVEEFLDGDKAHLIMERGYGGLMHLSYDPAFYYRVIGKLWETLSPDGGLMLLQIPTFSFLEKQGIPINRWIDNLGGDVYCKFAPEYAPVHKSLDLLTGSFGLIMLRRDPNSPEKLPHC